MTNQSALSDELQWRGMVKDRTFDDLRWLDSPRTFYLGSDCSSDSLTIGNLTVYMLARQLVDHGWKAVLLVGGATSLVGDPGGKDQERKLKSYEEIQQNVAGIKAQVERLFAGKPFETVNNYDWFQNLGYLEFLRDVGKHYSMTELLQRDFIQARLGEGGSGISYAEFSYSLIQGYDFWWLFKHNSVELQIGGSDQWGNMLSGVPLIRKKEGKEVHALSMPLVINKATGKKFGKSEEGAIWLDEQKTSVYKFYQFWLNVEDDNIGDFLKLYTLLSRQEIAEVMSQFEQNRATRSAQKRLAHEVTKLVHGEAKAEAAQKATEVLFGSGGAENLDDGAITLLQAELPSLSVTEDTPSLPPLLVQLGMASSNSEAMRLIKEGGITVNGAKVEAGSLISLQKGANLIRRGKNNFALILHT